MALPFAVSSDDLLVQPTRASLLSILDELKRPAGTVEPAERLALHPTRSYAPPPPFVDNR
jgi:hypothetical protein